MDEVAIAALVITDGRRSYFDRMIRTLGEIERLDGIVVDDSGDLEYNVYVRSVVPRHWRVTQWSPRRGLVGAIAEGWEEIRQLDPDYVVHIEDDFIFGEEIPLAQMVEILQLDRRLAQVVLKRQPWSPEEIAAGGIVELHPDDYSDCSEGDLHWLRHRRIFSFNPCVYPVSILDYGPHGAEAGLTQRLVATGLSFAFLGTRQDPPRCLHIGAQRSPQWVL